MSTLTCNHGNTVQRCPSCNNFSFHSSQQITFRPRDELLSKLAQPLSFSFSPSFSVNPCAAAAMGSSTSKKTDSMLTRLMNSSGAHLVRNENNASQPENNTSQLEDTPSAPSPAQNPSPSVPSPREPSIESSQTTHPLHSRHTSTSTVATSYSEDARATTPPPAPTPYPSPTTRLLTEAQPTTSTTSTTSTYEGMPASVSSMLAEHAQQHADFIHDHLALHQRADSYAEHNRELHQHLDAAHAELERCKAVLNVTSRATANTEHNAETSLRNALRDEINKNFDQSKRYHESMKCWEAITATNKSVTENRVARAEQALAEEKAEHDKVAREIEVTRSENRKLLQSVQHTKAHSSEVKVKLLQKENEIKSMREQIEKLKAHVLVVEEKLGTVNREKGLLKAQIGTHGKENMARIKERLQAVQASVAETEEKHRKEVEKLKSAKAKYEGEKESLLKQIADLTVADKKAREDLAECKKEREQEAAEKAAREEMDKDPEAADARLRQRVRVVVEELCIKVEFLADIRARSAGVLGDADVRVLLGMAEDLKQLAALGEDQP